MRPPTLHPRNAHRDGYDLAALAKAVPALHDYLLTTPHGIVSLPFQDANAVFLLNKALLLHTYRVENWSLPAGYLCPPVPSRADYLHHIADILSEAGVVPTGKKVKILDVGSGANCIYPLLGHSLYGWQFVAADTDKKAVEWAKRIVAANTSHHKHIELRWQSQPKSIFNHLLKPNEQFDCTMCNPPFFGSMQEAIDENAQKNNALRPTDNTNEAFNFGGQPNELWCDGGETAFVAQMIRESATVRTQSRWFSSLISRAKHLPKLQKILHNVGAQNVKINEIKTGNKIVRILFWQF